MIKRLLSTSFFLLLLAGLYLASLWAVLGLGKTLEPSTLLVVLCLWLTMASLFLLFATNRLLKKIWWFPASGEPVSLEQLQAELLAINQISCPVGVLRRRKRLILTWRCQELQWCEQLSLLGITRLYELHCRFDPTTHTVYLLDRVRSADVLICPDRVKIGRARIPLPLLRVRPRHLGTVGQYATQTPEHYRFLPREIKAPVMGTILASGWLVRFALW